MDDCDGALLNDNKQEDGRAMQVEKRLTILDMFGSLKMTGRSATCWAIWFIGSLGYYVFSLGSVNLGGNQYINLFLAGMFACASIYSQEGNIYSLYSLNETGHLLFPKIYHCSFMLFQKGMTYFFHYIKDDKFRIMNSMHLKWMEKVVFKHDGNTS